MTALSRQNSEETLKREKWMTCPQEYCEFPGLAYMNRLNQLVVARKLDKLHLIMEKHDVSYTIYNNSGEKVFIGIQNNQAATQYQIKLYNLYGNEVIHMKKDCNFFVPKYLVWAPPGTLAGSVDSSFFRDRYEVKNNKGAVIVLIKKLFPRDLIYSVMIDGEEVGAIMKDWGVKKYEYMVSFPDNLEVGLKAAMLGACFLIMQKCFHCWNKNR